MPGAPSNPFFALYLGDSNDLEFLAQRSLKNKSQKPHRFTSQVTKNRQRFHAIIKETEADGWERVSDIDGVQIFKKDTGDPLWMTKGMTVVEGATPEQVFAVIMTFGARLVWDGFFDTGRLVRNIDRETSVAYAAMKGKWPVGSRDTCVLSTIERNPDGSIYQASTSIVDEDCPEVEGRVRAELDVAGWTVVPISQGGKIATQITYYTRVDLKGSIPTYALKLIATQTPGCVRTIRNYTLEHACPPFYTALSGRLDSVAEFDHGSSSYELNYIMLKDSVDGFTEIFFDKRRYPNGFNATVNYGDQLQTQVLESSCSGIQGWHLRIQRSDGLDGKKITVNAKKNMTGIKITLNGVTRNPLKYDQRDVSWELDSADASDASAAQAPQEPVPPSPAPTPTEAEVEAEVEPPRGAAILNISATIDDAHRYAKEAREILEYSKEVFRQTPADGWEELPYYDPKVQLQRKEIPNHPMGLLRGDTIVHGYSPEVVFSTIRDGGCRKIWDKDLFDYQEVKEVIDGQTFLLYVRAKGQFPASPRDFGVLLTWRKEEDGTIFFAGKSVIDQLTPEVSNIVRGNLELSLWVMQPFEENGAISTRLTTISLNNPNGWLPNSMLKLVMKEIPKAVKHVRNFLDTYGPPPVVFSLAGKFENSEFDNDTSTFSLKFKHQPNEAYPHSVILLNKKRYANGAVINVTPPGSIQARITSTSELILVATDLAQYGQMISVFISQNSSGSKRFTFNGTTLEYARKKKKLDASKKGFSAEDPQNSLLSINTTITSVNSVVNRALLSKKNKHVDKEILLAVSDAANRLQEVQSQLQRLAKTIELLEKKQKMKRRSTIERLILLATFVIGLWLLWRARR